ncbi:serine hydrolase [Candidatus Bathyarchaeota archaeon]|nr:serine hydrolase [Candidatus Bathyarchaeota archaeon]
MEDSHAPAVSVALLKEGKIVYTQGYGSRDIEKNYPATPETLYGIGSCSKSFICLAVMQLVQEGKLETKDPIRDYLPLKIGYKDSPIQVHHLMSHSSGVPSLGTASILIDRMSLGEGWIPLTSESDFYGFVNAAGDEVDAEPGERYYYLNAGYTLLGMLIEKLSGVPLEEYLHGHIFKPLVMDRTTLLRERFEAEKDRMTAYFKEQDGKMRATVHPFHGLIYAPGGILSSTVELTRYLNMYLDGGKCGGVSLLDEGLLKEMYKPRIKRPDNVFGSNAYCYGWGVMDFLGHRLVVHTGSTGVSAAFQGFIPELDLGVAFLSNTGYWGSSIPHAALALLMGKDPLTEVPYLRQREHWKKLSGTYTSYRDILKVDVKQSGGMLQATVKGRGGDTTIPLIPVSDEADVNEFWVYGGEAGKMKVRFEVSEKQVRLYYERWVLKKPA